ncbi:hypothetical protein LX36DRAFT_649635 [Colletotrichum falcatum]|nr:hypothetical protein LX36DRAFT_649635 [Colletotrichum falcatum]
MSHGPPQPPPANFFGFGPQDALSAFDAYTAYLLHFPVTASLPSRLPRRPLAHPSSGPIQSSADRTPPTSH